MKKAADFLNDMEIPFEMLALSAHRTPDEVADFAREAQARGIKVIIAGAGMAAALPGVIAAITPLPVIGVPLSATLQGQDALLSIAQMPPGIPVATTGIDGAMNSAVLATRILALADENLATRYNAWRSNLGKKIVKANADLQEIAYDFKTN
jgi:5-(carboxyamino)imidazole ribonucleotide mutase